MPLILERGDRVAQLRRDVAQPRGLVGRERPVGVRLAYGRLALVGFVLRLDVRVDLVPACEDLDERIGTDRDERTDEDHHPPLRRPP